MIAWNEYFGFSLLCYIQRECNYRFTENGVHHKYLMNPPGFEIAGPRVRGLADFSAMPNIYPWEKREEWREVAEAQSAVENQFVGSGDRLRGVEWNGTKVSSRNIYMGPDIFLRGGELVDYYGNKRKLLGVEHFSAPLVFRNGVLRADDIAEIGNYVLEIDQELGLQGKFVEALWNISQFTLGIGISGRGELYMVADKASRGVLAMSCADGCGVAGDGCGRKLGLSSLRGRPGAVVVRERWCVELYRLFFENISLR